MLLAAASALVVPSVQAQADPMAHIAASEATLSNFLRDPDMSWLQQNFGRAKAVIIAPEIVKAGFMVGAQGGNGAMIRDTGEISGFYQTAAASYGLQAGVQQFGYALFLMDDSAFRNLQRSGGWEVGSSPSLVVVDQGIAATLSTATANKGTYAFFFNQRCLMGGLGLQGSKITRIHPQR